MVNITSTAVAFDFFYGPVPQEGQGSGFIIDKEGHILTNYHVIANAREVEVTLHNKKTYKATVIGRDRSHDLGGHPDQGSGTWSRPRWAIPSRWSSDRRSTPSAIPSD